MSAPRSCSLMLAVPFRRLVSLLYAAGVALLILLGLGCGVALRINHRPVGTTAAPVLVPGVPFYPKRARCRQEVVWFEPIYTLTLTALLPDKIGALQSHPRGGVVLSRSSFESQEVIDFTKILGNRPSDEGTVMRAWQKVVSRAEPNVLSREFTSLAASDRILTGRSSAPVVYVDYADQYYVNAKLPVAGSANVDAKVAADGSLSEVSGQVQTQTLQTILSALPVSSVITGGLGLGGKSLAAAGEVQAFQLTISISGHLHKLAHLVEYPSTPVPCPVAAEITMAEATEYKREDVAVSSSDNGAKPSAPQPKGSGTADQGKNPSVEKDQ